MGWYDAFKSNVNTPAILKNITSDNGSAAKNFGDAFKDFSKSLSDTDTQKKEDEVKESKIASEDAHTELLIAQKEEVAQNNKSNNSIREAKKFDDAFKKDFLSNTDIDYKKSLLEFEEEDEDFESNVSSEAFDFARNNIDKSEKKLQNLFNDKAVKVSVDGGYKDFRAFKEKNIDIVKNTDGTTMKSIEKYFTEKDTKLKDIETATKLLSKDKQIAALVSSKKNKGFVYNETTDTKIAAQVKTAMGMDADNFSFDDTTKKAYENAVAGSAKISKMYNLEPSLAIHVYQNPDMYNFTIDNKVIEKKVQKKSQTKDPLGIR